MESHEYWNSNFKSFQMIGRSICCIILLLILVGCAQHNRGNPSSDIEISLDTMCKSIYEDNVFLAKLRLKNNFPDEVHINIESQSVLTISSRLDSNADAILLVPNITDTLITADIFPEILFTDSAQKLIDYYSAFLSKNTMVIESNNETMYIIPSDSSIVVHVVWTIRPNNLAVLSLCEGLATRDNDIKLFVKLIYKRANSNFRLAIKQIESQKLIEFWQSLQKSARDSV